jgi:ferredoxin
MAIKITEDCISCGACEPERPNEAIKAGDEVYVINPNACSECVGYYNQLACQAVCPVDVCLTDPERVETEEVLINRTVSLHPDDAELRRKVAANDYPSHFRK